ncbi:fatty acid desaturase [Chloropicon primus]|uniref:Fatty acid desaturase n=1 Tax=Chloropicon primus TaxID=1764295 RepID=A0A5B8MV02_9CHLO|nr:fatty acid desaturase [Chloropicon primus]UPR03611.1 fatty acid desaturase [Chloropicon primus]|eukprot:QDZ24403.1 fatty acid desaturase [Chloropicon primus]
MAPNAVSELRNRGGKDQAVEDEGRKGASNTSFTVEEVRKHNTSKDLWFIIQGQVYDVTKFVPRHPGGSIIFVKPGGDVTQLFYSYHPDYVHKLLDKFHIGKVKDSEKTIRYEEDDCEFFKACRSKVSKYFKQNNLDPRTAVSMYVKTAVILATLVVSYLATFYWTSSFVLALLFGVVFGTMKAEVGVSIQHDANHGAYHKNGGVGDWMGTTLDLVGASSFMWKQQHVVGHHAYTNVVNEDPDIRVGDKDMRRCEESQPWWSIHRYQHYYLGFLYGLLSIKSTLLDDFSALTSGKIGAVEVSKFTRREFLVFWSSKVFYYTYWFVLPSLFSDFALGKLALIWFCSEAVTGWLLAFMFQVAHVSEDLSFYHKDEKNAIKESWAVTQVKTTADFSHDSFFWTHFSGGLNYQTVHHLFPGVCHCHYPQIAPIILETCKEFGIKYNVYKTFWQALQGHFKHLQRVGSQEPLFPSLATVG